jgi:hypothetical protein
MRVYTYSEARQNFASILDVAQREGGVRIARRDGRVFMLQPILEAVSPFEVAGVDVNIGREEIVSAVRESREQASLSKN